MTDRYSLKTIRDFWQKQAVEHGLSPAASWSDQNVIHLEINRIVRYLEDGDRVADIGCANGFSTIQYASQKKIDVAGFDYIPEMIAHAQARLKESGPLLKGRVSFAVGDILALPPPVPLYDKLVVVRVIINLGEWSRQKQGLQACARVLKPGGLLLLSEATVQGWKQLNAFRREWDLPDIPMPPFNNYLDQEQLISEMSAEFELVEMVNFASTYFVGTRVLKPLLIRALGAAVDAANPEHHWNRWFSQLGAAGDYGTQKLFVFKRR